MYLYAAGIGCKIQAHYKSTNNSRARELCDKTFTEECKFMGKELRESRLWPRESRARGWTRPEVGFTQFLTHKCTLLDTT